MRVVFLSIVLLLAAACGASAPPAPTMPAPMAHRPAISWHLAKRIAGKPHELQLFDGTVVREPSSDSFAPHGGRCIFHRDVPPNCGDAGAFHRFYTSPGASYIAVTWSPSSNTTTLPTPAATSDPSPVPATGLLYAEGWPTAKLAGPSTEAGFQYDPGHNWFLLFQRAAGKQYWYADTQFAVAQLSVTQYASATCPTATKTCAAAAFSGTCYGTSTACSASHEVSTPGWAVTACCVMASMIAVAEPAPGRSWTNGAIFGPTEQSACATASLPAGGCVAPGLLQRGQRYPNDRTRIIVREAIPGLTGTEIDTIDLHP